MMLCTSYLHSCTDVAFEGVIISRSMARARNEICVEWLGSKDKSKTNRVNVKHVIGNLGEVEKDSVVTVRFNSHRYQDGCYLR